ncbi:NAD(P)-dependent alcohol dehydrogenase [Microbacterium album]|uniref:NADPH:quinone reductase n=1 Tax=Microbacterium album TaxID=2053191 RepID=A0A917IFS8_9MICO|nr:NAD(P)-dependent alcohol dehydrogenase [Microbacterium album]GGH48822.1 NADPH:quinone reductase [Microbacterium album]
MPDLSLDGDAATALPATITAWRQRRYGGPETVTRERIDLPQPGRGEVLLRVRATALNAGDIRVMRGTPYLVRAFFGLTRPRVPGRGMDVAGTVVALGEGVDAWAVGDEVVGELPGGGLAEYVVAPATALVGRPETVTAADAAAVPVAAGTAWQALELARTDLAGRRVLVVGASGGVGTFAVQLAVARGAEVWALCGERNRGLVAGLGATEVHDYRGTGVGDLPPSSCDVIVDIAGTAPLRSLRRALRDRGTAVLVAGDGGGVLGPIPRIFAALFTSRPRRRIVPLMAQGRPEMLRRLLELVDAGTVRPVIERTYPLDDARAALAHVDAGRTVGKVVVVPDLD